MNIILRLQNYYADSDTFSGKKNGLLQKILEFRFKKCFTCKKYMSRNNINICGNCAHNKCINVQNYIINEFFCPECETLHRDEERFTLFCEICQKESNIRFFNINNNDICFRCFNNNTYKGELKTSIKEEELYTVDLEMVD